MSRTGGLADVVGLRVGHRTAAGDGWLTGTTVVLAPPGGMVAGVDIRGGAPGTRETDLLDPTATVDRVHALVLTGGSAYGLAAADGVTAELGERGVGVQVGPDPSFVVPIVPAAVVFDLARGGAFAARPDAGFGRDAVRDALAADPRAMAAEGSIGAGTGACTGRLKGGVGQASAVLPSGATVSALVVANATGPAYDPRTGELWAARLWTDADGPVPGRPVAAERDVLAEIAGRIGAGLDTTPSGAPAAVEVMVADRSGPTFPDEESAGIRHTTLGVVATDAVLTKAQCTKLAAMAHDGLARAVNPVHTMFDGDLFFGVSTGTGPELDALGLFNLLTATADVVTRALGRAVLAADPVTTPGGSWPSYRDLAPSAVPAAG
ncbi:P1 family peptidase [Nakamurella deserti]|uniref:P1 family peptidase n=1 Tax=Nakamurella deserti TaxID=2164074 RepID=UPI000DBE1D32|nr:P1 family peptidase [Nakamurella deserti]